MNLVELTPLRNSLVGIPGSTGLSVEQRKRLTIAVELVANPSIIFMDEPTTGESDATDAHSCQESASLLLLCAMEMIKLPGVVLQCHDFWPASLPYCPRERRVEYTACLVVL